MHVRARMGAGSCGRSVGVRERVRWGIWCAGVRSDGHRARGHARGRASGTRQCARACCWARGDGCTVRESGDSVERLEGCLGAKDARSGKDGCGVARAERWSARACALGHLARGRALGRASGTRACARTGVWHAAVRSGVLLGAR
ncbi:hypothetical protein CDL15_Pgr006366 [Punica granatum]|uniref:Uncharacterized protein n=1 Tax=Punica granatum TaxID=22663 RepID=A0A218VUD1_PUNGR|nr:hypothetical protein CDL15_Pgr006366 [Punica granatum]